MPTPDPSDFDRDVDDSMRLFERAHVGPAAPLQPIRPGRVLLVLDGSDQDQTSIGAALTCRERFNTETLVLDARDAGLTALDSQATDGSQPAKYEAAGPGETSAPSRLAVAAAEQVSGARAITRAAGESFEAILASLRVHQVDLVIVPCPYGRSFDQVGIDSVGTVIDVLLNRCSIPFLVIRRGDQDLEEACRRVSVLIGSECDVEQKAAAWAFGLAAPKSEISLNLVVEQEHYENVRSIVEALRPGETFEIEKLSDMLTQTHRQLHGAMSKTATSMGHFYHLLPQAGAKAPPNPLSNRSQQLLVLPLEVDDRFAQGFVHDRIRRSPHPVLVIPTHVRQDEGRR